MYDDNVAFTCVEVTYGAVKQTYVWRVRHPNIKRIVKQYNNINRNIKVHLRCRLLAFNMLRNRTDCLTPIGDDNLGIPSGTFA